MWRLLLIVFVLGINVTVYAEVIETVEWESKPGVPWFYTGSTPEIDCSVPASPSGGCALRFRYDPGTYSTSFSGGRAERQLTSERPKDLYIGHWNRYSAPFNFNPSNQKIDWCGMLQGETPLGFGSNLVTTWNGSGSTISGISQLIWGNGSTNHYPNALNYIATEHLNEWYWFEQRCKVNTPGQADGIYELWINDVLIASYSNLQINESGTNPLLGWGVFYHTAEWGGGGGVVNQTQYWWVDHTMLSTTRIGMPGGSAPLPSTAPPNAPSGLIVTELWDGVKAFVALIWQWIGPSEAHAAVANDTLTLSWQNAQAGVDYELRWQSFAHPEWMNLGLIPSNKLSLIVPLSPPVTCVAGTDCYVCADARAKRLSDGVYGPWLSATTGMACNQFAVGPIVIPPPPPTPAPVLAETFKNVLKTDLKLTFQYAPTICPRGIGKTTGAIKDGVRTVTLTCLK